MPVRVVAIAIMALLPLQSAAEDASDFEALGEVLEPDCRARLERIAVALEAYEADRGAPPLWLSDLVQAGYLDDTAELRCPVTEQSGEKPFLNLYFEDPRAPGSYFYEFCPVPVAPGGAEGSEITMRAWKLRQRRLVGGAVPMVRCLFHGEVLNIGADYTVFSGPLGWEDSISDPQLRQAIALAPHLEMSLARMLGETLPPFEITPLGSGGEPIRFDAQRGKPLVLIFFSSRFPPSLHLLHAYSMAWDSSTADLWGIAVNDDRAAIELATRGMDAAVVVALDESAELRQRFSATELPLAVVIDADGVLRYIERGIDSGSIARLNERLEQLTEPE